MAKFASNYLPETVLSYLCLLQFKLSAVLDFSRLFKLKIITVEKDIEIILYSYNFVWAILSWEHTPNDIDSNNVV